MGPLRAESIFENELLTDARYSFAEELSVTPPEDGTTGESICSIKPQNIRYLLTNAFEVLSAEDTILFISSTLPSSSSVGRDLSAEAREE